MKRAAPIFHLLWAAGLSGYMLWISAPDLVGQDTQWVPIGLILPLIAVSWMAFAVGLFFGRAWAWSGAFVFTLFSLFVAMWFALQTVTLPIPGELGIDLAGSGIAFTVVALLLHTRHSFLIRHESSG
jgi:hypothetical protein